MTCDKGSLARVSVNRRIYSFCGRDGNKCFSDVEMFDPVHGKWIKNQPMLKKRVSKYSTLEHVIKSTRLIGSIIPQLSLAYHAKECYMYFAFLLPSTSFL